jgi:dihydrofolate synthase/folylpolyglutamate synthase
MLAYQLKTHPQQIAMGLERVREVAIRMRLGRAGKHIVTIAGTNGKGSTVAFVEAIAREAGCASVLHLATPAAIQRARARPWR